MTEPTTSNVRGWVVVAAATCANLVLGALYSWGVLGKALATGQDWTATQQAMPFTASSIAFAVTMIFAGRLQDRIGPRLVVPLGGLMLGLGLIASAWVYRSPTLILLTFGIVGGMGIGLGYSATTPPVIKWFPPARKGLVAGIVVSGVGLSAVFMAPLSQWLLTTFDLPHTFIALGVLTIAVVMLAALFLKNPPAGYVPPAFTGAGARKAAIARRDVDWPDMLRTAPFWLLWLMFVLAAAAGLMIMAHAPLIARDHGWSNAPLLLMVVAIFNTLGRLGGGVASDRIGRTTTMVLAFVLQAANMLAFPHYNTWSLMIFGSAFTGLCYGTLYAVMPAATADFFGLRNLGVNFGLLFTAFGVAAVVGPIVAGRIRDASGSYTMEFMVSAVLLLIAAVLALFTHAPKVPAEAEAEVAATR